jgi:hypothetical protein
LLRSEHKLGLVDGRRILRNCSSRDGTGSQGKTEKGKTGNSTT